MEKIVKQANGQWSVIDEAVEKTVEDDAKVADIKRRHATPKPKSINERAREIKDQYAETKEPSLDAQISRKKRQYTDTLELSEQEDDLEPLEKMRYMLPRGSEHGFDMPKNPELGHWGTGPSSASKLVDRKTGEREVSVAQHDPVTNKPMRRKYSYTASTGRGLGYSHEALSSSHAATEPQIVAILHREGYKLHRLPKDEQKQLINGMQNMARAHEVQHDIVGHLAGQVKHVGDYYARPNDPTSRPFSSYLIANANLTPHEAHLLDTSLSTGGVYNMFEHPHEAIAHVAQWLHSGSYMRDKQWQAVKDNLPGETLQGYTNRLKDIHKKITNTMSRLRQGQEVTIPSDVDYTKRIHGVGWHHSDLNEHPDFAGHTFQDLRSTYVPHGQAPVKKSVALSVAAGLQPSSEQWEAAAAQMLGLPTDQVEAERLGKVADAQWNSTIADSFKSFQTPVERQPTNSNFGRGPVNQNDESSLTDEERRIRAIPVNPELLKG